MREAIVDSNVLFAYRSARDQYHESAKDIVDGIDAGELPRGIVANYTLPEVINPISKRAGHGHAVETLDFLTESRGFRIRTLTDDDLRRGQAIFRNRPGVEITDAVLVAYARRIECEYVYSFDDDFDRFDSLTRLATPDDPFR